MFRNTCFCQLGSFIILVVSLLWFPFGKVSFDMMLKWPCVIHTSSFFCPAVFRDSWEGASLWRTAPVKNGVSSWIQREEAANEPVLFWGIKWVQTQCWLDPISISGMEASRKVNCTTKKLILLYMDYHGQPAWRLKPSSGICLLADEIVWILLMFHILLNNTKEIRHYQWLLIAETTDDTIYRHWCLTCLCVCVCEEVLERIGSTWEPFDEGPLRCSSEFFSTLVTETLAFNLFLVSET